MEEVKEHWKVKQKRLKEEAEARGETIEEQLAVIAEDTKEEVIDDVPQPTGRGYKVYNARADLVAGVDSIEEAEEELTRFPKGFYKMV